MMELTDEPRPRPGGPWLARPRTSSATVMGELEKFAVDEEKAGEAVLFDEPQLLLQAVPRSRE